MAVHPVVVEIFQSGPEWWTDGHWHQNHIKTTLWVVINRKMVRALINHDIIEKKKNNVHVSLLFVRRHHAASASKAS